MTDVKICGVKDPTMMRHAAEAGTDWIGFNFVEASPRYVAVADAAQCLAETGFTGAVALVVDATNDLIATLTQIGFSNFQLHGAETPQRVAEVKALIGGEVWKAVGVKTHADLVGAEAFTAADRLLIDAKPPKGAQMTGGHGAPFDWGLLKGWKSPKPWLLAGGLTPENVGGAIAATGAPGVDVSSGVERMRGVKDADKITAFIKAAKG